MLIKSELIVAVEAMEDAVRALQRGLDERDRWIPPTPPRHNGWRAPGRLQFGTY